jgi:hypothetical protein
VEDNVRTPPAGRSQPIELIIQLMQHIPTLHSTDEALLYLAQIMVNHLQLPCLQIYALQHYENGQEQIQLRASASSNILDPTFLSQAWYNTRISQIITQLVQQKKGISSVSIEKLFPSHQITLLNQQHIHYWSGYFYSSDILLPPPTNSSLPTAIATPLTLMVSLFTAQPLSENLARKIPFVINQSLRVMDTGGLFSIPKTQPPFPQPSFLRLIPRHTQQIDQFQATNPFASAVIINDKQARQLYISIDGRKNISALARSLPLDKNTLIKHLRFLYTQHYIAFYDVQGSLIDPTPFF